MVRENIASKLSAKAKTPTFVDILNEAQEQKQRNQSSFRYCQKGVSGKKNFHCETDWVDNENALFESNCKLETDQGFLRAYPFSFEFFLFDV